MSADTPEHQPQQLEPTFSHPIPPQPERMTSRRADKLSPEMRWLQLLERGEQLVALAKAVGRPADVKHVPYVEAPVIASKKRTTPPAVMRGWQIVSYPAEPPISEPKLVSHSGILLTEAGEFALFRSAAIDPEAVVNFRVSSTPALQHPPFDTYVVLDPAVMPEKYSMIHELHAHYPSVRDNEFGLPVLDIIVQRFQSNLERMAP